MLPSKRQRLKLEIWRVEGGAPRWGWKESKLYKWIPQESHFQETGIGLRPPWGTCLIGQLGTVTEVKSNVPSHSSHRSTSSHTWCSHLTPLLGNSQTFQGCLSQARFKQLKWTHLGLLQCQEEDSLPGAEQRMLNAPSVVITITRSRTNSLSISGSRGAQLP